MSLAVEHSMEKKGVGRPRDGDPEETRKEILRAGERAFAASGLAIFLLSVPAQLGVNSRSRIGFVLPKDVPLRLTPTEHAQFTTRLVPGEPARLERIRGRFVLIRTSRAQGWVEKTQFAVTCSKT